jgi:C-terminal processing protease CtpA/Prc
MRKFTVRKRPEGGFGFTLRGNKPVFVRSVDFDSHAHSAGLRSGDLLVQFNERNVRSVGNNNMVMSGVWCGRGDREGQEVYIEEEREGGSRGSSGGCRI